MIKSYSIKWKFWEVARKWVNVAKIFNKAKINITKVNLMIKNQLYTKNYECMKIYVKNNYNFSHWKVENYCWQ